MNNTKTIGQLFEEYSAIISRFSLKYHGEDNSFEQLNRYFPMHVQESEMINWRGFSHEPLELVQDKVLSLSTEPFKDFFKICDYDEFDNQFGILETSFDKEEFFTFRLYFDKKPTNMYLNKFGYINISDGEIIDENTGAVKFVSGPLFYEILKMIREYDLDLSNNELKYITYNDFKEFHNYDSDVIIGYKTKTGWYGGSHRARKHFIIGEEIEVPDDSLLLSSGYVEEKSHEDLKERNYIKSLIKNNKLLIKDDEIAKFLCYRLASSTG